MPGNIPFSTFKGYLKQLRLADAEQFKTDIFHEVFPKFFETNIISRESRNELKRRLKNYPKIGYQEDPAMPRRFAGIPSLARGCYYSVCRSETGDDGGTLANELKAYRNPHTAGYVRVSDNLYEKHPVTGEFSTSLFITWYDCGGSPYVRKLLKNNDVSMQVITVDFPYDIVKVELDHVIDLRYPHVRRWFYEIFTNTDPEAGGIFTIDSSKENLSDINKKEIENEFITMVSRYRSVSAKPPVPSDFAGMLPTLMNPDLGGGNAGYGSTIQAIGTWLRQHAVSAFIYPSARSDVTVKNADGDILDFSGWNLVDYRSNRIASDHKYFYIVQSPWCWTSFVPGCKPDTGEGGFQSFGIDGIEEYWNRDYLRKFKALTSIKNQCSGEELFADSGEMTFLGSWRLGEASINWLIYNIIEGNRDLALKSLELFTGFLLILNNDEYAGLLYETADELPVTNDVAFAITKSMDITDYLADSYKRSNQTRLANILILSNRLHELRFYILLYLKALTAGYRKTLFPQNISNLFTDFNIVNCEFSVYYRDLIVDLFKLGISLLSDNNDNIDDNTVKCKDWVKKFTSLDVLEVLK